MHRSPPDHRAPAPDRGAVGGRRSSRSGSRSPVAWSAMPPAAIRAQPTSPWSSSLERRCPAGLVSPGERRRCQVHSGSRSPGPLTELSPPWGRSSRSRCGRGMRPMLRLHSRGRWCSYYVDSGSSLAYSWLSETSSLDPSVGGASAAGGKARAWPPPRSGIDESSGEFIDRHPGLPT